jgi:hypothetical protein
VTVLEEGELLRMGAKARHEGDGSPVQQRSG